MGKILVTGALGNVGRFVATYLLKQNQDIVLGDISVEKLNTFYGKDYDTRYFDFTDESTFNAVLKGVDRIFIIRPPHIGDPKDLKVFIDYLKPDNIKLITFLSLIGIEKNPIPPHYKIEKYIEKTGCHYCHIRPSFFMQNISGIHAFEIKYFDTIVVPVKKAKTSFIDAEDIGELIALILTHAKQHQNKAYSITGPEALDYDDIAKILSHELKRHITYGNPNPRFAKNYWINIRKINKKYATVMGLLYMMTRFGTAHKVTSTFEDIMHRKPTSFNVFAQKNRTSWLT